MATSITIQIPPGFEGTVQRFVAFLEEMQDRALRSPDGRVIDDCEEAVLVSGREVQQKAFAEAIQHRIEAAEKKGLRSGAASAAGPRKTGGGRRVSCSPASARSRSNDVTGNAAAASMAVTPAMTCSESPSE